MTKTQASERRVRQVRPVDGLLSASTLGRVDYADAFDVYVQRPLDRSAEEWMRTILAAAPVPTRVRLVSAWSTIGLKLRPPGSGRSILGWNVRATDVEHVLLGADSRIGMPGELLLRRRDDRLVFATFVRHDNAVARALWASIERSHVQTVRSLLEQACR
ncbi:hypothetical protein [Mycolicibacterium celeriflavum]|uniref:hypothetical protein n=1 Tax=Mycolicibacterium celeriflavum TaxID=1249101 RepID=UPI003CF85025